MPFAGIQSLVNGWIKVNSKEKGKIDDHHGMDSSAATSSRKSSSTPQHHHGEEEAADPEIRAIRRYNGRKKKNRSKLERSVSLTDLLREMANEKEVESKQAAKRSTSNDGSVHAVPLSPVPPPPAQAPLIVHEGRRKSSLTANDDDDDDDGVRFVAGFFGAELPPPPPPLAAAKVDTAMKPMLQQHLKDDTTRPMLQQQQQEPPRMYMAADGSPRILVRPRATDSLSRGSKEDDMIMRGGTPPLHPPHRDGGGDGHRSRQNSNPLMHRGGGGDGNSDSNSHRSRQSNPMQQFFMNFPNPNSKRCASCEEVENRLIAMQSDLQYLRSITLRNEYNAVSQTKNAAPTTAQDLQASGRLADMEAKHVSEMEQMTKERSKWQENMHAKLSTFANIAKDLNEESAFRKREAIQLEDELMSVRSERDALALQVEQLQTATAQYKLEQVEHAALKERMKAYELEGLGRSKETTDQRDEMIRTLAVKLESTLEALDMERKNQRQRRQIIFPPRGGGASHPIPMQPPPPPDVSQLSHELTLARKEAQMSDMRLAHAQSESARTEAAFRAKIETLERQLDQMYHSGGTL